MKTPREILIDIRQKGVSAGCDGRSWEDSNRDINQAESEINEIMVSKEKIMTTIDSFCPADYIEEVRNMDPQLEQHLLSMIEAITSDIKSKVDKIGRKP